MSTRFPDRVGGRREEDTGRRASGAVTVEVGVAQENQASHTVSAASGSDVDRNRGTPEGAQEKL
ncbi:hypothetical protein BTZ20_5062 [Rhodococcus sp. MTM3W5.2]|nr:hypothetical protein BTZ20_5062 [Rhodococcus sp. MTM3W5.2]